MLNDQIVINIFHALGEGGEKVQRFKRWLWAIVEKMNTTERQDLVSAFDYGKKYRILSSLSYLLPCILSKAQCYTICEEYSYKGYFVKNNLWDEFL